MSNTYTRPYTTRPPSSYQNTYPNYSSQSSTSSTSTNTGTPAKKPGVPTWAFVVVVIILILVAIFAVVSFISLQNAITEADTNICPALPANAGAKPIPVCCGSIADCPTNGTPPFTTCTAQGLCA